MISTVHSGLASAAIVERRKLITIRSNAKTKTSLLMRFGASGELVRSFCAVTDRMEKSEFGFLANASMRLQVIECKKATVCRYSKKGRAGSVSKNDVLENRVPPKFTRACTPFK
jgi:hypothetical protein